MRNLLLIIIAVILAGCNKNEQYIIKGYVQNRDSGVVTLSQTGEIMIDLPEYHLSNGEFYFEGKIDHPEDFTLYYKESESARSYISFGIFIEPSAKVNVTLYPDSISKSVIKGSKMLILKMLQSRKTKTYRQKY